MSRNNNRLPNIMDSGNTTPVPQAGTVTNPTANPSNSVPTRVQQAAAGRNQAVGVPPVESSTRPQPTAPVYSLAPKIFKLILLSSFVSFVSSLPTTPNFVFLHCESTDGRLYYNDIVPLPNIKKLAARGALFAATYANAPVCCPSRSSMLSGKYPHKLPHWHNGILVPGVYNNYEGLDANFSGKIQDLLQTNRGYDIQIVGKTDWTTGSHTESCMLEALTHNVAFPYNVSLDGGWQQESICSSNGTIGKGGSNSSAGSLHMDDWNALEINVKYIENYAQNLQKKNISVAVNKPFFVYQGFNILHPDYVTNEYWYNSITANITVPEWLPLNELHPCDLQASMLKGCLPSDAESNTFNDPERIKRIRRIYYAELAEYDAMVGAYIQAIEDNNLLDSTIFILDADHGEMQLEHRQFYKMVQYEGSSHVPLLISHPSIAAQTITQPTQLLDLFPTFLELAGIPVPSYADGYSLVPFLLGNSTDPTRPDYVLSQFHGDDIAMSWFMIRQGDYKYINFGLGNHSSVGVVPQLFNLQTDPNEMNNLWTPTNPIGQQMEQTLLQAINYPQVAMQVAQYQKDMFNWWIDTTPDWKKQIQDPSIVRWATAWAVNSSGCFDALQDWLDAPTSILPCRNTTVYV